MPAVRISERVTPFVGAKVDREAGVISGALICGAASKNRRDYAPGSFGDGKQYEGRQSFTNHRVNGREVHELLGWWSNVAVRECGRPFGDFNVLKTTQLGPVALEVAERNPALLGFSHVAQCRTKPGPNGREVVEHVGEVESIDLVVDPATTPGIFESFQRGRFVATIPLRESVGRFGPKLGPARWGQWQRLAEDAAYGDLPVEDMPDATGEGDAESALQTLIAAVAKQAIAGEITPDEAAAKVKAFLETHLGTVPAADDDDPPAEESRKKARADGVFFEALAIAHRVGLKAPTENQLRLIALSEGAARETTAREFLPPREVPRSAGRDAVKPLAESLAGGGKPADRKLSWD